MHRFGSHVCFAFQQFAGINGVLYYTPQILEQAGVDVLLANIGIRSDSASILISALTTLLMLPAIGVAMRLMDLSGRRLFFFSALNFYPTHSGHFSINTRVCSIFTVVIFVLEINLTVLAVGWVRWGVGVCYNDLKLH